MSIQYLNIDGITRRIEWLAKYNNGYIDIAAYPIDAWTELPIGTYRLPLDWYNDKFSHVALCCFGHRFSKVLPK